MKIGIIGTGNIAQAHGEAIKNVPNGSLEAILSRNFETAQNFSQKWAGSKTKCYTNINEFLSDSAIDMVLVASPDKLHYPQVKKSLEAGKHVLSEKPFTTSVQESQELADIAKAKNLKLGIGFHLRQHNGHKKLKEILNQSSQKPRHLRATWSWSAGDNSNWRAHPKVAKWWSLSGVGVHCIDISRWFLEDFQDWDKAQVLIANNIWNGPHDETAIVAAQFQNGTTLGVTTSVQYKPYSRLELFYEDKIVVCDETFGRHGGGKIFVDGEEVLYEQQNPFENQIIDFIENENIENNADVGVRSNKDLQAIIPS